MIIQDSRIKIKRSTVALAVPTVPTSDNHTDGSWSVNDIYKGEFYMNLVDGKIYTRFDSGIKQVLTEDSSVYKPTGNNFGADAILGLTSNHNLSIYTNNAERIKITSTGLVAVAQKLLVGDTDTSLLSTRDFVVAGSGNTSASDCLTLYNSDFGTPILRVKNDGNLVLSTGLQDSSGNAIVDIPNREYTNNSGTVVLGLNAKLLVGAWGCDNNFRLTNNTSSYIWGTGTDDGDWRTRISGTDLITERREGGVWVLKNTIAA